MTTQDNIDILKRTVEGDLAFFQDVFNQTSFYQTLSLYKDALDTGHADGFDHQEFALSASKDLIIEKLVSGIQQEYYKSIAHKYLPSNGGIRF